MTMPISLDSRVTVPDSTASRELDNETVLLNLDSGIYFGLDPIGTRIWQLLGAGQRLCEVLAILLDEYEVDEDRLSADLLRLARELVDRQLIVIAPEKAAV
jgi:hypothetical protein